MGNDYVKKRSLSGTGVQRDKYITGVSCGLVKGIEEYITSGDWSEKVINFSAKYSSEGRHTFGWHLPRGGEYSVEDSVEERSEEGRR